MSDSRFEKFQKAVDVVCGECGYLDEETCETCPVRKTMDDWIADRFPEAVMDEIQDLIEENQEG